MLQVEYIVIGPKYRGTKLPRIQISTFKSWAEPVEPLNGARVFSLLHPLWRHVYVIQLKWIRIWFRGLVQSEIVVDVKQVVECFLINLVAFLWMDLLKRGPLPLESARAAHLAQDSDCHALQRGRRVAKLFPPDTCNGCTSTLFIHGCCMR